MNYSLQRDAEWIAFKWKADDYVTLTVVHRSECKVMHNIWRDAETAVAPRRTHDEIAAMAVLANSVMTLEHKKHPAIKAAAPEFVRS